MLALVAGVFSALPAAACQLALAVALDVSSSVDAREYALQRNGLASALLSDEVQALLFSGGGGVALAVYEWSGFRQQDIVLDWTLLAGPGELTEATGRILRAERQNDEFPTSLGAAIGFGVTLLERAPGCARRTLDVTGDGINNHRYGPRHAYGAFPVEGITVNGLVIDAPGGRVHRYYRDEVIRGPGAFVELALNFDDYEDAMRRKLLREIASVVVGARPAGATGSGGG